MNEMSEFRRANLPAAPPGPTGAAKAMPWLRSVIAGGFKIGLLMYVAQQALPYDYKPSVVFGRMAGTTEYEDVKAKGGAVIDFERGKADAVAQAQAKAQADVLVLQKTLETTTASVDPLGQLAGSADVLCVGGRAIASMSAPSGQVRYDDSFAGIVNRVASAVASVSCGVSEPIRESIRTTQLNAVREVAAARNMPMTNGAAPVQAASARSGMLNLDLAPHLRLTAEQQRDLRIYANGISVDVLRVFVDGLDMTHGTPDTWYDRVAYYRDARRG